MELGRAVKIGDGVGVGCGLRRCVVVDHGWHM